jgi:RNA polymerase sigma-70 factor, ECF subfamily
MTTLALKAGGGRRGAYRALSRGTVVDMHASTRDHERADLGRLMARVAEGDQQAFAEVYDATSRTVFGIVLRVLRDRAQAEEVTQEVYVDAWRQAKRFDGERGSATSWLNTIAHRKAVDRVRSAEAARHRDDSYGTTNQDVTHDSTSEAVVERLDAERVHRALTTLTEVQRQALELAYLSGYTHT